MQIAMAHRDRKSLLTQPTGQLLHQKHRPMVTAYGCVNCVAVLVRRGGNHVGIVSGYDEDGDPIIISGNHDGVVGIGAYRREKVIGYRSI